MRNIKEFRNQHIGESCWVLGNGPSLKDDARWERALTFGTNRIDLHPSGFLPRYYVAVNPLLIRQFRNEILELETVKFLPGYLVEELGLDAGAGQVVPIDTSLMAPAFSSPEGPIWEGHTVTYVCLQLAYYMGFTEVFLSGVDHDYGEVLRPNLELVATGPDRNHFHPEYFPPGTRWNAPDLQMSELAYTLAKAAYEADGRAIVNRSKRTKLTIFPMELGAPPSVSAIVSAYRAADFLPGLFADLEAQTLYKRGELEIVFVCQEDSPEHDCIAMQEDLDYELVTTPDMPSVYAAWNLGIKASSGRYITNANSDDRHAPMAYELMAAILSARPEIDLVYHDSFITWRDEQYADFCQRANGAQLAAGREQGQDGYFKWHDYTRGKLGEGCFIGPHPMWRANLHQRFGYFLEHWKSAGDYEFWLRCAGPANFYHLAAFLGLYRARLDGIELSDLRAHLEESQMAQVLHQNVGESSLHRVDDGTVRLRLGDEWVHVDPAEISEALEQVMNHG